MAINEPSVILEDGLDGLDDVPGDNEPRRDKHVGSVSAPVAGGLPDYMRAPLSTSARSTSASSRAISPISSLSSESAAAVDSEVVPVSSPSPAFVSAPRRAAASGPSNKGKERATADTISSAIADLAIEAYVPGPVTVTSEAAPGASAKARGSRRGRSATQGKATTVVLTPLVDPIAGDTPQVPVAPPSRRKRRQG